MDNQSNEKSLNLSLLSKSGDFSPFDSTEQLVNSTSKLVMSISEDNLGMNGGFTFLLTNCSQFSF